MHTATAPTRFTQLHIDIARFSTDDFNPFHDQKLWWQIPGTPFSAPLVLGFQLAAWIDHLVSGLRPATRRPVRTRFPYASPIRLSSLLNVSR